MSRRYRDLTFRRSDVVRAYRAAQDVGMSDPRIEIDKHGTISIIPGKLGSDKPPRDTAQPNPWDEVLTDAANKKRSA